MRDELISIIIERIYEIRLKDPDITGDDLKEQLYDEVCNAIDDTVTELHDDEEEEDLMYF